MSTRPGSHGNSTDVGIDRSSHKAIDKTPSIKTLFATVAPLCLLALSLLSLALLIDDSALFNRYRLWLLGFNVASIIFFFILTLSNLVSLWRRLHVNQPGSRLTLKLVRQFLPVALIPAAALYLFSYWAVDRGIDSWFDVRLETAFDDAIKLGHHALAIQTDQMRRRIEPLLGILETESGNLTQDALSSLLAQSGADELVLLSSARRVISSASSDLDRPLPELAPEQAFIDIRESWPYINVDTFADGDLYVRMVFLLPPSELFSEPRYLQALFRMSKRVNTLAGSVQDAYRQYNRLDYQREALKRNFIFALSLALLLGVFYVIWLAFRSSRKLMHPIVQLSAATDSISSGDLDIKLDPSPNDDLGFLSSSFGAMAGALAAEREKHVASQRLVENQRAYLSAVIERVASGVLTLDRDFRLITANEAAEHILGVTLKPLMNRPLRGPASPTAVLLLHGQFPDDDDAWKSGWQSEFELTTPNARKTIACRGASLPRGGGVVVFNDVSQLMQAQRNIVWREAARRFAHEIKNPLTPIQLAAERLRYKLKDRLDGESRLLLDDTANMIAQQVEAMRGMVDNLRNYADNASPELIPVDLNRIVSEVAGLYETETAKIRLQLDDGVSPVSGNEPQLKQLLHNLIKNALEATAAQSDRRLSVETARDDDSPHVHLTVRDNGEGFAHDVQGAMFEPYVTTKARGDGLGLAVVNRIVAAHDGEISVGNLNPGAYVRVSLRIA